MVASSIQVRMFLSWCHADRELKTDLLTRLEPNLAIMSGVEFGWWEDSQLELGEAWRRAILQRIAECDYGILLLSPGFFASRFIGAEELPRFVGPDAVKGALPVLLRKVPLDGSRALKGVEDLQIFIERGKSYAELTGADRDRFAMNLASQIVYRILGRDWREL